MVDLEKPMELLELADGQSLTMTVTKFIDGETEIEPGYLPKGVKKRIKCLRVYVPRAEKPAGADYWDITSQTLIYTLLPLLQGALPVKVQVTAHGWAPRKRSSVVVLG